jgi:hypothetical protein
MACYELVLVVEDEDEAWDFLVQIFDSRDLMRSGSPMAQRRSIT